jgi:peptidoglycan L-alanyl-D-glutamate endopeptidase CwlK
VCAAALISKMKALLTWFQKLWLRPSNAGPVPTSVNSSASLRKNSTPALTSNVPLKSEAKASEWQADPRSEKNLATVQPQLQRLGRELLRRLAAEGLTFKVTSGNRTQAEQDKLYSQGRNGNKGPVVTWTRKSRHIGGKAIDLTLFSGKNPVWDSKHYDRAGVIGEELGLVWGGRWKRTPDRPHFELPTA